VRILYAPRNISGQFSEYQNGFKKRGIYSEIWSYDEPKFGFSVDRVINGVAAKSDSAVSFKLFAEAVETFDVFHFTFGRSLLFPGDRELELIDLPLLQKLNKKVIMHFRGSDVRLKSLHTAEFPSSYMRNVVGSFSDEALATRVNFCREYSSCMLVSTPGLLSFVPDAVLLRHVVDVGFWSFHPSSNRKLRVLHVPSARITKSSDEIVRVCESLADSQQIDFRLVENVQRSDMPALLQSSDVIIDSMGIGDHGLVSVEAMACGVVPIANLSNIARRHALGSSIQHASLDMLPDTLMALAGSRENLDELKMRGRDWVERNHTFDANVATLLEAYTKQSSNPASPLVEPPYRLVNEINSVRSENRLLRISLRMYRSGARLITFLDAIRNPTRLLRRILRRFSRD
jgi:hypothetical protein